MTDRLTTLTTRLDTFITDLGQLPVKISKDDWLESPLPPRHRIGWAPPIPHGDPKYMISYCPELLVEWGEPFDDAGFSTMLDVIEVAWARHLQYLEEGKSAEERSALIEDELFDNASEIMLALGAQQMAVLDRAS